MASCRLIAVATMVAPLCIWAEEHPLADQCAPVMSNMECRGSDMQTVAGVNTTDECCGHCTSTKNCGAYTHDPHSRRCVLKRWCDYLVASKGKHSSMPDKLPATPPPSCSVPELGIGFNCEGEGTEELALVHGDSQNDCCDLCSKMDGCLVYSFNMSGKTCSLKKNCPVKPENKDFITGWVVNRAQKTTARYQVGRGSYELPGYQCGGGNPATVLFYPKGTGPFPVVVYGHGAWGYVDGSDNWLQTVSSLGLIVIAPFQGKDPHPCKEAFADDLLTAIEGSKKGGAKLHPALGTANWTKTGIFGHSKGAKYATLAASKGKKSHGVSAVVCSCDAPSKEYPTTVPTMLTTGTLDKFNDKDQIRHYWEESMAEAKVYVNLKDAYHMEVQEGMRLNLLTGRFLSCHVSGNPEDCNVIYGAGEDSICKVNDYADGSCCVQRGSESISKEFCSMTPTTLSTTTVPTTTTESTTTVPATTTESTTTVPPTPMPVPTPTPMPTPVPTPTPPPAAWIPCASGPCCNPRSEVQQFCPGGVACQECGGDHSCQCPGSTAHATTKLSSTTTTTTSLLSCSNHWEQCGGGHWHGPTECCAEFVCQFQNDEYSQCVPATFPPNHALMV